MIKLFGKGEGLAISYLRFSSRKQRTNDSYRRQSEATEKYCKDNGLNLIDRLEDLGISAWTGKNLNDEAALGDFLNKVNSGKIPKGTTFICENLDRITRAGIFDALNIFSNILKAGIDIVTTMDNKRYSYESVKNNVGELIVSITYLTQGNIESEKKSERVKESWVKRRSNVRNGTFAKFHCPSWLEHDGKEYSFKQGAKETVKKIFELYTSGMGTASVVKALNKQGIKSFTKTGKWNLVFLHEILQNPAVIGTYALIEPHVKNYYPAVVSEDLYYKALTHRKSNNNFRGHTGKKEINLFGGLCKCPKCGSNMVKYSCKGKGRLKDKVYTMLACSLAKIGKCQYSMIDFNKMQDSFLFVLNTVNFSKMLFASEVEAKDETEAIAGKLTDIEKTIARVADAIVKSDSPAMVLRLTQLEQERKAIKTALDNEITKNASKTDVKKDYSDLTKNIWENINNEDFRFRLRGLMRKHISKIVTGKDGYEVYFIGSNDTIRIDLEKDTFTASFWDESQIYDYFSFKSGKDVPADAVLTDSIH